MSALAPWLPGARVLDLFAGSGALGLECLSRGAREVVFVEHARPALMALRENIAALGAADRTRVVAKDVFRFLEAELDVSSAAAGHVSQGARASAQPFDIAVADPPYDRGLATRILQEFERRPFASQLWIEHSVSEPLSSSGFRQRRYGDTILTTAVTPESEPSSSSPTRPEDRSTP